MASRKLSSEIFDFFASVRLTVALLLTLAATSVIGTVIPQNQDPAAYFHTFGLNLYRLLATLDMFDMYHSWWFQLLLALLTVNIIVCSMDRLPGVWKMIAAKPAFRLSRFHNSPHHQQIAVNMPCERIQADALKLLSKNVGNVHTETTPEGVCIWGETGRWTRIGVYVVHLSVILLLAGGLIGSFWGFDGTANIAEGDTISSVLLNGSTRQMPLGFQVRCDKFSVQHYDSGTPREYRSTLTILEQGKPVLTRDILVNDPLRYRGINFFQSSYGTLPPQHLTLTFTSRASGMEYRKKIEPGQTLDIPENLGTFMVTAFHQDYRYMGTPIGSAFTGMLTPPKGTPVEVVLPLRFPKFDKMRQGDVVIGIAEAEQRFYTGLQITRDPGVWVVYTGFLLMITGCIIAFFMSHQQMCIEIHPGEASCEILIHGIVNKNRFAIRKKMDGLAERLLQTPTPPAHA
jgi:cytochrome c biogenesis protein